jgi:hypothetical protein
MWIVCPDTADSIGRGVGCRVMLVRFWHAHKREIVGDSLREFEGLSCTLVLLSPEGRYRLVLLSCSGEKERSVDFGWFHRH